MTTEGFAPCSHTKPSTSTVRQAAGTLMGKGAPGTPVPEMTFSRECSRNSLPAGEASMGGKPGGGSQAHSAANSDSAKVTPNKRKRDESSR